MTRRTRRRSCRRRGAHSQYWLYPSQEKTAELQKARFSKPIATEIVPAEQWWSAEDYHQQYLVKNPGGYCNHRERW